MFDLNSVRSVRQSPVEILHPLTGQPVGARVTLIAIDHPRRKQALLEFSREQRALGEGDDEDRIERRRGAYARYVGRCIDGWEGIAEDGVALECTEAAAVALLSRPELNWLLDALHAELTDEKNFLRAAPPAR